MFVQTVQQLEGVAASNEDCLRRPGGLRRVLRLVDAGQLEAPASEGFPRGGGVLILLPQSVGNKQDLGDLPGAQKLADGVGSVLQVPGNIRSTSSGERGRDLTNPVGWRVELERSRRFLISVLFSPSQRKTRFCL